MAKKNLLFLVFAWLMAFASYAQVRVAPDTLQNIALQADSPLVDSAHAIAIDTLTPNVLKIRDSLTNAKWIDSLNNGYGFEVFSLKY